MEQHNSNSQHSFTVLNMSRSSHAFEVHSTGCRDIKRAIRQRITNSEWEVTAANAREVVDMEVAEFDANDQGWAASDFKVHTCARKVGKTPVAPQPKAQSTPATSCSHESCSNKIDRRSLCRKHADEAQS